MGRRWKIGNKNKLILTEIFLPSVHETWYWKELNKIKFNSVAVEILKQVHFFAEDYFMANLVSRILFALDIYVCVVGSTRFLVELLLELESLPLPILLLSLETQGRQTAGSNILRGTSFSKKLVTAYKPAITFELICHVTNKFFCSYTEELTRGKV